MIFALGALVRLRKSGLELLECSGNPGAPGKMGGLMLRFLWGRMEVKVPRTFFFLSFFLIMNSCQEQELFVAHRLAI